MQADERYLVYLDYYDIDHQAAGQLQPDIKAFPSIAQALLHLMSQPLDMFDRTTAGLQGMNSYIHEAALIDVTSGSTLARTVTLNSEQPVYKDVKVFLFTDERQLQTCFSVDNGVEMTSPPTIRPHLVPFLATDNQQRYLYPTKDFLGLAQMVGDHMRGAQAEHDWQFTAKGLRLAFSETDQLKELLDYTVQHHFTALNDALAHQLTQPAADFEPKDKIYSHQVWFTNSQVSRTGTDEVLSLIYAKQPSDAEQTATGRFLLCPEGWERTLTLPGSPPPDALTASTQQVQLNTWSEHGKLIATPAYYLILTELAGRPMTKAPFTAYAIGEGLLRDPDGGRQGISKIYHHYASPTAAIAQALVTDMRLFGKDWPPGSEPQQRYLSSGIQDAQNLPLLYLERNHRQNLPSDTSWQVRLTFKDEIADFLAPQDGGLRAWLREAAVPDPGRTEFSSIAAGHYALGQPHLSPLYARLQNSIWAAHLSTQISAHPELAGRILQNGTPEDRYQLQLSWSPSVRYEGQAHEPHTYTAGFKHVSHALRALERIDAGVFDRYTQVARAAPLWLSGATVVRKDDQSMVASLRHGDDSAGHARGIEMRASPALKASERRAMEMIFKDRAIARSATRAKAPRKLQRDAANSPRPKH